MTNQVAGTEIILLHFLKPVGGILCCDFDWKGLPIKLPSLYEDCLKSFAKCSVANNQCEETTDVIYEIFQKFLWNNKFICIDGKPLFYKTLSEKEDLKIWRPYLWKKKENELISNGNLR